MNVPLNIDWQQILLHLFNFVILAGGLYFLLYKPVRDFMDKRTAYYQSLDADTKKKLAEAGKLEAEYQSRLADAEKEIREQKARVLREAEAKAASVLEEAGKQKEQLMSDAVIAARREKERIVEDARVEIAELAVAAAAKILQENALKAASGANDKEAQHG